MRNPILAALILSLFAAPAGAARNDLDRLVADKTPGPPRRCIFPDRHVQPEIVDGTAIVYRDARYTYVARFKQACPALREDRRITTRGAGGQLCENDPVHISETTGHYFGFCTFDKFVPYRKR